MRHPVLSASALLLGVALLAGCASDPLAEQFAAGTQKNYSNHDLKFLAA